LMDEVTTSDSVSPITVVRLFDEVLADDILILLGVITIETKDLDGNPITGASYRITPNPFGGVSPYLVQDGILNDDDTVNDGRISVYYVPLDLYLVNRTGIALPPEPLYNFTHITVHRTDFNATGLFRVLAGADIATANATEADIIDINVPPGFDSLTSSINLNKVRDGIQTPITKVSDLPPTIFAGALNSSAIDNATKAQYTLLYKNAVGLTQNESPQDIKDFFGLARYDTGNYTNATFVGVLTSTEQEVFGQYIATQPLDGFTCGKRHIFTLDDSLVPTYGGITDVDLTPFINGTCPRVEDYLTYEIQNAIPLGTGLPSLEASGIDEDTLLYIRAQYPNATGAPGLDFSNSTNIESYTFKIISRMPETEKIADLSVYVYEGGWTKSGVNILSRQLLSSGPNDGMAELTVSVDHTSQFVVGGKKIEVIPLPPIVFESRIDVSHAGGGGSGNITVTNEEPIPISVEVTAKSIEDVKLMIRVVQDGIGLDDIEKVDTTTKPEEKEPTPTNFVDAQSMLLVMIIAAISTTIIVVLSRLKRGFLFA